jgi:hypothetical protein
VHAAWTSSRLGIARDASVTTTRLRPRCDLVQPLSSYWLWSVHRGEHAEEDGGQGEVGEVLGRLRWARVVWNWCGPRRYRSIYYRIEGGRGGTEVDTESGQRTGEHGMCMKCLDIKTSWPRAATVAQVAWREANSKSRTLSEITQRLNEKERLRPSFFLKKRIPLAISQTSIRQL